jgi:hypothetical protein
MAPLASVSSITPTTNAADHSAREWADNLGWWITVPLVMAMTMVILLCALGPRRWGCGRLKRGPATYNARSRGGDDHIPTVDEFDPRSSAEIRDERMWAERAERERVTREYGANAAAAESGCVGVPGNQPRDRGEAIAMVDLREDGRAREALGQD